MTTPSHIAVGYMIAQGFVQAHLIAPNLVPYAYGVSIISANLPDLDVIIFRKLYDHRTNSPFHYPFTWWVVYVTLLVASLLDSFHGYLPLLYLSILCVLSHFLMDSFGVNAGIRWFAPFHKKEYSFLQMETRPDDVREWVFRYLKHPIMLAEVALWVGGILLFISRGT